MRPLATRRRPHEAGHPRNGKTRVLVADDHPIICDMLRTMIGQESDLEVVGQAGDGEEAIRLAQKLQPDVAVMDMVMPQLDGMGATERLRPSCPNVAVLILSGFVDPDRIASALRAGAMGFVPKLAKPEEILRAIRCLAGGATYLDHDMAVAIFRAPAATAADAPAGREVEILKLAVWGYGNKEIADRLDLTVKAVECCKTRCMASLGLKTRHDLVQYAVDHGWLAPGSPK